MSDSPETDSAETDSAETDSAETDSAETDSPETDAEPGSGACCAPARSAAAASIGDRAQTSPPRVAARAVDGFDPNLVLLAGGTFEMGSDAKSRWPADGEGPARPVTLEPFRISRFAVTNAEFAGFVEATGHRTEAEVFGWSFVFGGLLPDDFGETRGVASAPWWRQVFGADWRHPAGPQSSLDEPDDLAAHPVVHVSHNDALAYCAWAGVRLPTEAQWEFAARGGLHQKRYPWGNEFAPDGVTRCNIFEGSFPDHNTEADGYRGTAPVDAFAANGFGLFNVSGNVWEWCADWFHPAFYAHATAGPQRNPTGPPAGETRVMRGGSYLCHDSYCDRYRVAARSANSPDSSTGNLGFRVAAETSPDIAAELPMGSGGRSMGSTPR